MRFLESAEGPRISGRSPKTMKNEDAHDAKQFDKACVERIPPGQLALSIAGSPFWCERGRAQLLFDTASATIKRLIEDSIIPACGIVRLLVVTSDIENEIRRWQREVGRPEVTSSNMQGQVAGKSLVWGTGELRNTYGIIILREEVALALIEAPEESQTTAKAILVHELAHVHDDYVQFRSFGPSQWPMNNDWPGVRRFVALAVWGEFFADFVAHHYLKGSNSQALSFSFTVLEQGIERIRVAILEYQTDGDIGKLWQIAVDQLSRILNQFGRTIGLLSARQDEMGLGIEALSQEARTKSANWVAIIEGLSQELNQLLSFPELDKGKIGALEDLVEQAFHVVGLRPRVTGQGLWLDVTRG